MTVESLSWLQGTWRGQAFGGLMEECYGSVEGGCILGTSRVVVDGKTIHKEFISVDPGDGVLTYTVLLPDKTHNFPFADGGEEWVVWEDPGNPWPKQIRYERSGQLLVITLTGESRSGEARTERIEMHLQG